MVRKVRRAVETYVMRGYCEQSNVTNDVLNTTTDGHYKLLHTVYLGKVDYGRLMHIVGKFKELRKLENGKHECPTP